MSATAHQRARREHLAREIEALGKKHKNLEEVLKDRYDIVSFEQLPSRTDLEAIADELPILLGAKAPPPIPENGDDDPDTDLAKLDGDGLRALAQKEGLALQKPRAKVHDLRAEIVDARDIQRRERARALIDSGGPVDLDTMNAAELRAFASERGLTLANDKARSGELRTQIAEQLDEAKKAAGVDLAKLDIPQLRRFAEEQGIELKETPATISAAGQGEEGEAHFIREQISAVLAERSNTVNPPVDLTEMDADGLRAFSRQRGLDLTSAGDADADTLRTEIGELLAAQDRDSENG